ncbi:hypothetical protein [Rhizobium mesosinicum]|uniref:Uncharacterized protein n=1 Tax=Rhizobium mesosinicum TaxID=335017 RepID=A0ABS7GRB9_9HYPH|nr:hypothetical protein [Rhizobium mesosinicum]MBW9051883.1 hypothetical protein [Rhizobium mesosinicum]
MRPLFVATLLTLTGLAAGANASEADFLNSLEGDWSGSGMVMTRIGGAKVNVSCNLKSDASAAAVAMNGSCRGLAIITKSFSANVKAAGQRYVGNYTGPSGQPSKLVGSRTGDALNFNVTWARVTNGDRSANMMIEKVGQNGLRLQTVDRDPASGRSVVTSRIDLQRQ